MKYTYNNETIDVGVIVDRSASCHFFINWYNSKENNDVFCFADNCVMKIGVNLKNTILDKEIRKLEHKLTKSFFHDERKMDAQINKKKKSMKRKEQFSFFYKIISFIRNLF